MGLSWCLLGFPQFETDFCIIPTGIDLEGQHSTTRERCLCRMRSCGVLWRHGQADGPTGGSDAGHLALLIERAQQLVRLLSERHEQVASKAHPCARIIVGAPTPPPTTVPALNDDRLGESCESVLSDPPTYTGTIVDIAEVHLGFLTSAYVVKGG